MPLMPLMAWSDVETAIVDANETWLDVETAVVDITDDLR